MLHESHTINWYCIVSMVMCIHISMVTSIFHYHLDYVNGFIVSEINEGISSLNPTLPS